MCIPLLVFLWLYWKLPYHSLLQSEAGVVGLILVPSKELTQQIAQAIQQLAAYCGDGFRVAALAGDKSLKAQQYVICTLDYIFQRRISSISQGLHC